MPFLKPLVPASPSHLTMSKTANQAFKSFMNNKFQIVKLMLCSLAVFSTATLSVLAEEAPILFHAQGGATKTLWGDRFEAGATVLGDSIESSDDAVRKAISTHPYDRESHLPKAPSDKAKPLTVLERDPNGRVLAVVAATGAPSHADWTAGPDVIWVRNGEAHSAPILPKVAQARWVFPDRANPLQTITLFGRNLASKGALIALKKDGKGEPVFITPLRGGTYRVQFQIPSNLPLGDHTLFFHNGRGGAAGWSGPIGLTVQSPKGERSIVSVSEYGARGIGAGDDTEAIRKALAAAAKDGAIVVLPPGNFPIRGTLQIPPGVSLRGAGLGATTLQVHPETPFQDGFPVKADIRGYARDWFPHMDSEGYVGQDGFGPMVWLRDRASVENMTLLPAHGSGMGILVANEGGEPSREVAIRRVKVEIHHQPTGWLNPFFVAVLTPSEHLRIEDSEFIGAGGIGMHSTGHRQMYIARNKITGLPQGERNLLFLRSLSESVVENNHIRDGDRNIVYQSGQRLAKEEVPEGRRNSSRSSKHNIYFKNIFENNVPRDHNAGEIMFEVNDIFWGGNGSAFTADGFSTTGDPFNADLVGNHVVVLDGKGVGQYREIVANTDNSITINRPWDVVPNADSYMKVGAAAVECIWLDNTDYHIANWTGLWGNNFGNVIDGHIQHGGNGLFLWSPANADSGNPRPTLFNDIINCRIIGRGNIVLRGHFVLGNTVRLSEVIGFRYRPNYHGNKEWTQNPEKHNPGDRAAVELQIDPWNRGIKFPNLRSTSNYMAWNIIEFNNIYDGPLGIRVDPGAKHTIIRSNAINVDGEEIILVED